VKNVVIITLILLALPMSKALASPYLCPYDASKVKAAVSTVVSNFLENNIKFPWNKSSLTIRCTSTPCHWDKSEAGVCYEPNCKINFSAQDGTTFMIDTAFQDFNHNFFHINGFYWDQAVDSEGNYSGPVNCENRDSLTDIRVANARTGLEVARGQLPKMSYQK
jgi:hypothetical protein